MPNYHIQVEAMKAKEQDLKAVVSTVFLHQNSEESRVCRYGLIMSMGHVQFESCSRAKLVRSDIYIPPTAV